jgi:polysaccharide chain length determinant protein (PEP-CTERM system associated)
VLPGRSFAPSEIIRILTQRGWLIVLPFALGLSAAPILARQIAKQYRSETLIMVVPQRFPDTYVKSTVTAKMEDRLPSISSLILSRSRLERTVMDFNLYPAIRAQRTMDDVVERMRDDIEVKLEGQESFRVSYVSSDPAIARDVTSRLASLFIDENLRDRETLADQTNRFLESQVDEAKSRLVEHEKKLEEYRKKYAGELPTQLESNLQSIRNTQLQLQATTEAINRARERRLLVERQIADERTLPIEATVPLVQNAAAAVPLTVAQQLETARAQLEQARRRYTPEHPDVRSLERSVRELEVKAKQEEQARAKEDPNAPLATDSLSPAQLAREKHLRDLQAELEVVDHQLGVYDEEEKRLKQSMSDYQGKVDAVPTRESELVELTRDYGTLQAAYTTLLSKREDSKIAADLERRQIGEQFRIVDQASLPQKPYNQSKRLAVTAAGAIAGLVIGLLLVVVLELRDSSLKREEDVVRVLSLPVLALVPMIASKQDRRRRQLGGIAANVAAAVALLGSMAILVVWRLHS